MDPVSAALPKKSSKNLRCNSVKDPVIKVETKKLYFKGVGGTDNKEHEVEMEFFKEIDVEVNARIIYIG